MTLPRLTLPRAALRGIVTVLDAQTDSFVALARAAGLDRAQDFRGAILNGVDFGTDNLAGFDFCGADLTGANLARATGLDKIITDANTRLPDDARRSPRGFNLAEAKRLILSGEVPPKAWWPFIAELDLSRTSVTDLAPLSHLTALQRLDLTGTGVSNLEPLSQLRALRYLRLADTHVGGTTIRESGAISRTSGNIFISYAQQDWPIAVRLRQGLENRGISCWLDRDVTSGESIAVAINHMITGAQVILVVLTANADKSYAVVRELKLAHQHGLIVIPLRVGEAPPTGAITPYLSTHITHDISDDWESSLDRLYVDLGHLIPETVRISALQRMEQRLNRRGSPSHTYAGIWPLSDITDLQSLDLRGTDVTDLSPLSGLTMLQDLQLGDTQVGDVSPLSGLTTLQELYLSGTKVSDVSPLSGLIALQCLSLGNTRVSDVSSLSGLSALRHLYLGRTQVSDVSPLSGLTALESLNLSSTRVSDVSPLSGLTALRRLYLWNTQVSDVALVAHVPYIEVGWEKQSVSGRGGKDSARPSRRKNTSSATS